jgi:hypothetical protein
VGNKNESPGRSGSPHGCPLVPYDLLSFVDSLHEALFNVDREGFAMDHQSRFPIETKSNPDGWDSR